MKSKNVVIEIFVYIAMKFPSLKDQYITAHNIIKFINNKCVFICF